jgi:hypothetical protein
MVECLLCKCEVLSANSSPTKKKKKKEKRMVDGHGSEHSFGVSHTWVQSSAPLLSGFRPLQISSFLRLWFHWVTICIMGPHAPFFSLSMPFASKLYCHFLLWCWAWHMTCCQLGCQHEWYKQKCEKCLFEILVHSFSPVPLLHDENGYASLLHDGRCVG